MPTPLIIQISVSSALAPDVFDPAFHIAAALPLNGGELAVLAIAGPVVVKKLIGIVVRALKHPAHRRRKRRP